MLLTCGAFTPQGEFLELPELDLERLQAAWQEAVFALYVAEYKIEPDVIENMRTWPHISAKVTGLRSRSTEREMLERLDGVSIALPANEQHWPDPLLIERRYTKER